MVQHIIEKKWITPSVFTLRFSGEGFSYRPGQYLMAGPAGLGHLREYSIASTGESGDARVLVKRIDGGFVSPRLAEMEPGDELQIRAPFGEFLLPEQASPRLLFVASGTGIAPFVSLAAALPEKGDYLLLHGTRYAEEAYLHSEFDPHRLVHCVTRGNGDYPGRVTDYFLDYRDQLKEYDYIYACGNSDMIYELFALARRAGFSRSRLRAEIYF